MLWPTQTRPRSTGQTAVLIPRVQSRNAWSEAQFSGWRHGPGHAGRGRTERLQGRLHHQPHEMALLTGLQLAPVCRTLRARKMLRISAGRTIKHHQLPPIPCAKSWVCSRRCSIDGNRNSLRMARPLSSTKAGGAIRPNRSGSNIRRRRSRPKTRFWPS